MFVYIWKSPDGTPFYVGCTNSSHRANPRNSPKRNWLCMRKLEEIGRDHVIVELRFVDSITDAQELERKLIAEYGRIQTGNGSLTNLMPGGEGVQPMSKENRQKRRESFLSPDSPVRTAQAIANRNAAIKRRMNSPDVKLAMQGENNPAKKPEVRAKLKSKWEDPEYQAKQVDARTGLKRDLPENTRAVLRENLANNPAMLKWGERNGKDPEFDTKRILGIKNAQPKRREKMSDPVALAQRKERLKATMNSPEYKAKRAQWDTPEYREKLAKAKREYWAKKKLAGV